MFLLVKRLLVSVYLVTSLQPAHLSLVGEADMGGMWFDQLSRRHVINIPVNPAISVEKCSLAVGGIVGYDSVVSASRTNGSLVIFSTDKSVRLLQQVSSLTKVWSIFSHSLLLPGVLSFCLMYHSSSVM